MFPFLCLFQFSYSSHILLVVFHSLLIYNQSIFILSLSSIFNCGLAPFVVNLWNKYILSDLGRAVRFKECGMTTKVWQHWAVWALSRSGRWPLCTGAHEPRLPALPSLLRRGTTAERNQVGPGPNCGPGKGHPASTVMGGHRAQQWGGRGRWRRGSGDPEWEADHQGSPGGSELAPDFLTPFSEFPGPKTSPSTEGPRFGHAQLEDPNLVQAWRTASLVEGVPQGGVSAPCRPNFKVQNGLLNRVADGTRGEVEQLLVLRTHVTKVLFLGHLFGAHLGKEKTHERIRSCFYWPGVKLAVEEYFRHCSECQLHSVKPHDRSLLVPLPIIGIPFQRIEVDIVGPLPKSSRGHWYILVVVDYATCYLEEVHLRAATGKAVARELSLIFSQVGIAQAKWTDQGTCFMSQAWDMPAAQGLPDLDHLQMDRLVERFNWTLKRMMQKMIVQDCKDWDQLLPYLLFAIREVRQSSTGFTPFQLLYGRWPRGLDDRGASSTWPRRSGSSNPRTTGPWCSDLEHVGQMVQQMEHLWTMVRQHIAHVQAGQVRRCGNFS